MKKLVVLFAASVVLLLAIPSATRPAATGVELNTIVIDPGHGGNDPGCNGAGEIWEKAVTLAVSLKLGKLIEDSMPGVKVIYTRKTDKFVALWERPNMANKQNADLFVSIHCNSNTNTTAAGSETYFMGVHKTQGNLDVAKRENAAVKYEANYKTNERYGGFDPNSSESHIIFSLLQNAFITQSMKFSTLVEDNSKKYSKLSSRGVKQAGFLVLWQTAMPSVLVEIGFLTNSGDRAVLKSEDGQMKIAKGILKSLKEYKKELEKSKTESAKKSDQKTGADSTQKSKS